MGCHLCLIKDIENNLPMQPLALFRKEITQPFTLQKCLTQPISLRYRPCV